MHNINYAQNKFCILYTTDRSGEERFYYFNLHFHLLTLLNTGDSDPCSASRLLH